MPRIMSSRLTLAFMCLALGLTGLPPRVQAQDWSSWGQDPGGQRFSALTEITPANVGKLKQLWSYSTGENKVDLGPHPKRTLQAVPILVDGRLIFPTFLGKVIALDASTGKEVWATDLKLDLTVRRGESAARGVSVWREKEPFPAGPCTTRLFLGTLDARLIALDAATGVKCETFGEAGAVDLTQDVGLQSAANYMVTSPPVIAGDRVIVGSAIGDNRAVRLERGIVRAFDARTGTMIWSFDPLPRNPDDPAHAGWKPEQVAATGAANVWAPMSLDAERGIVYLPTGSASPDHYGGERLGSNDYANSLVALDVATGKRLWHRQLIHHDLWDYDLPAQPVLTRVTTEKGPVDVVIQVNKTGMIFVFDRVTGEPVFPITERPVPKSDVPGEESWPTQPFPEKPEALANSRAPEAWGLTPIDRYLCAQEMKGRRSEGIFTPPSLEGSIIVPSIGGGMNWGGAAVDPSQQVMVTNANLLAHLVKLVPRAEFDALVKDPKRPKEYEYSAQRDTPYGMMRKALLSPLGLPCTPPPWGVLAGIDLKTGDTKWKVPLGNSSFAEPFGLFKGVPALGGPMITAGGLVFIAGSMDPHFRAFDISNGKELWKVELPASGQSNPMSYADPKTGRQIVVIAAGGHSYLGTKLGDEIIAFGL